MYYVGQRHAVEVCQRVVEKYVKYVKGKKGEKVLIIGRSGQGKTTLAKIFASRAAKALGKRAILVVGDFEIAPTEDIVIFDEAHLIEPQEKLFPILGEGKRLVFATTNLPHLLGEPLRRRMIEVELHPYSREELEEIAAEMASSLGADVPEEVIKEVTRLGETPGEIEKLIRLLGLFQPQTLEEFQEFKEKILMVGEDGLSPTERKYLDSLREVGGRASLRLMTNLLTLPEGEVCGIEASLVAKGRLRISNKGRELLRKED